jgi:succinoglycan biosynthesis protein ExoM
MRWLEPEIARLFMSESTHHISVGVCTYKRPQLLKRLFERVGAQETEGRFTFSLVIADNDDKRSAEATVAELAASCPVAVRYCVEPRQNIALARNKLVENSEGDFIAFIDDDEFPEAGWLLNLFMICQQYQSAGVLGPVRRHFDIAPPKWVSEGSFYTREEHPTGFVMGWHESRTGNLLFRRALVENEEMPFRPEFRAGEDQDFFRRKMEQGEKFIWCNEAVVYEVVPPSRWDRTVMLKRALLRGATAVLHPTFGAKEVIKSLVAVPLYIMALPFVLLLGQHRFMNLLIRLFDHLGKLLALVHLNPIREQYVTE